MTAANDTVATIGPASDAPDAHAIPVPAAAVTPGQTYYLSINLAGAPLPPPVPISFQQQLSLK